MPDKDKDFAKEMEEHTKKEQEGWEEVVETQAEIHNFEENDTLVGVLVEVQEDVGENNSKLYKFEVIGQEELVGVWGSHVLDSKLKKMESGQEIKIVYLGKVSVPNSKRSYKNWQVFSKPVGFKEA
ncbi:MAG TPA: hypothetical protein ENI23_11580 [bacterium]|nr:hypothetical protein [bacterium]